MTAFEELFDSWKTNMSTLNENPWVQRLATGEIDVCHYKGYLRETYHHAGLNPQIQAYATMFFREKPRDVIAAFYKHAISEIGHDLLALNDLVALGENSDEVVNSKPLPSTLAFNTFALGLIQFYNPITYLGYLFHLEFLPTQNGSVYMEKLSEIGIPNTALTFLEEHATVDAIHNKFMENYVKKLIKSKKDLDDVIWANTASINLHSHMITDAFENGEKIYSNNIQG